MPHAMTLLLAADTETAVEHADVMALNLLPAITSMVVFLLAFGFLYLKVWPKILKGLDDRDQKIRQEIANAEEAREKANATLAEYERELASARQEANDLIAQARAAAGGDLERIARVVKLGGFINAAPGFSDHPKVINGASDLMVEVFGEQGRHARFAVGAGSLPFGVAVEVDGVFELNFS